MVKALFFGAEGSIAGVIIVALDFRNGGTYATDVKITLSYNSKYSCRNDQAVWVLREVLSKPIWHCQSHLTPEILGFRYFMIADGCGSWISITSPDFICF